MQKAILRPCLDCGHGEDWHVMDPEHERFRDCEHPEGDALCRCPVYRRQMTGQEIFNRVWAHSATMTRYAFDPLANAGAGRCAYLDPSGLKCFIGSLIPDGHPAQKSEKGIITIAEQYPTLPFSDWALSNRIQAGDLQLIHDVNFQHREILLREFAKAHGFTIPA